MEKTQPKPIHLTFRSVQQVIVEPDDEDRFVTTAREAARACQQVQAGKEQSDVDREWDEEFRHFLSYVHAWCLDRTQHIDASYVDVGDGGLRVSICVSGDDFDFDFDDQITELDIELAEKFPHCLSEATQIPRQIALRTDLPSESSIIVYGNNERSPETSGT